MNKIFVFWLGNSEIKKNLLDLFNKFKTNNYIFELGPTTDDHKYLYNTFLHYKHNYDRKKYAFCSDVWRIWKLNMWGGIYIDAHMFLSINNINIFLTYLNSFKNNDIVLVKESSYFIMNGFMKFSKKNVVLTDILSVYEKNDFEKSGPFLLTYFLIKRNLFSSSNLKNSNNKQIKYIHCSDFDYRKSNSPMKISSTGSWHTIEKKYSQEDIDLCWFPLFDFYKSEPRLLRLRIVIFRLLKFKLIRF